MRFLYSSALYLLLPTVWVYFAWRGLREPDYLRDWSERLGYIDELPADGIWIHAASVGEVVAAAPLIRTLRERYPDSPCLVTTVTPTGRQRARAALGEAVHVAYLPFDVPGAVRRFLRRTRPRLGILLEAELWPNLLHGCRLAGIPLLLANARLSESRAARYRGGLWGRLIRDALLKIDRIAAVGETDAARFAALDVPEERISVAGNLKFDLEMPPDIRERGAELRREWRAAERPVWIAASTHAGEEEAVLDAHEALLRQHPNLLLILVPRHPQRFDAVADLCRVRGFDFARRSRNETVGADTRVLLGDTLGELPVFYAAADAAFVGGSLVPDIGGHNLLEPAALRLPSVTGTHLGNWAEVTTWLSEAGALHQVADAAGLAEAIKAWLEDDSGRETAGRAAANVVDSRRGALQNTLRLVSDML